MGTHGAERRADVPGTQGEGRVIQWVDHLGRPGRHSSPRLSHVTVSMHVEFKPDSSTA